MLIHFDVGQCVMRSRFSISLTFMCSAVIAACSTHPLVDERTGLSTSAIVQKVRCEARDALAQYAADVDLEQKKKSFISSKAKLKAKIKAIEKDLSDLNVGLRSGKIPRYEYENKKWKLAGSIIEAKNENLKQAKTYLSFVKQVIAYDFRFTITENNDASGSASIIWPIHFGTAKFGGEAHENKSRQSDRHVKFGETIEELLAQGYCENIHYERSLRYPIKGYIGLGETIDQYMILREADKLRTDKETYSDNLKFTTEISGTTNANVTLSPSRARTISAGLVASASRKDLHDVTIQLTNFTTPDSAPMPEFVPAQLVEVRILDGGPSLDNLKNSDGTTSDGQRQSRDFATEPVPAFTERILGTYTRIPSDADLVNRALRELDNQKRLDADRDLREFLRDQ